MIPPKPRPDVELNARELRVIRRATDTSPRVLVGVTTRVPVPEDLDQCLTSIENQTLDSLGVVLLLDGVDAAVHASSIQLSPCLEARTWVLAAHCGTPARARNAILDFIDEDLTHATWVARLDVDDSLACPETLAAAVTLGDQTDSLAILGGNRVLSRDGLYLRDNIAKADLLNQESLLLKLHEMAEGTAHNELPSCNLLLRARSGIRYPDMDSAEDHWLVASILFHRPHDIAILEEPLFANYKLGGLSSQDSKRHKRHTRVRAALSVAAQTWAAVLQLPGEILGFGQEGIVRRYKDEVIKHFYPKILTEDKIAWLESHLATGDATPNPKFEWDHIFETWIARYPYLETSPLMSPSPTAVHEFMKRCLAQDIVCANIKRSNFRVRPDGTLIYIDIGNWIIPMNVSYFRDASARLYSIGVRDAPDDDLQRRVMNPSRPVIWNALPNFINFYGEVVEEWIRDYWGALIDDPSPSTSVMDNVTLLLKACAMDSRDFRVQVTHLVDQLSQPRAFASRVLVIDSFEGPFLRQHATGDLNYVIREAQELVKNGTLDRILMSPVAKSEIRSINQRWFGVESEHTHSLDGVPITPQVWAFDQIETQYVLQGDLDVLVGRRDLHHDYLNEMIGACEPQDVVCVAFNIPHPVGTRRPYFAPQGEYKPEVRLGLLDLHRLRTLRPLPADVREGKIATTWYRALHQTQRDLGLKTVRGGDSDTFYVHPMNDRKSDATSLARIRDLIAQGLVPPAQMGRWDLEAPDEDWHYTLRSERVVILALGRNTPTSKIRRFSRGLAIQDTQDFGVIVIDDASEEGQASRFQKELAWLGERLTLIRNADQRGRVENYRLGIHDICENEATMIVIVDQDDALAHPRAIRDLLKASDQGHDVVLAAPFRPDHPTQIYEPQFSRIQESYGGDVWIHMRAFRKQLFDELPDEVFEFNGQPLKNHIDYATMIPIVKRARSPVYLPYYRYWHERTTVLDSEGERERDRIIQHILQREAD